MKLIPSNQLPYYFFDVKIPRFIIYRYFPMYKQRSNMNKI
ncbi:hypothetical protein Rhal01_03391 [Rubritalea halochordaticola]|uniref:Uncharacterized protein n=1 Tax=Rubritalea halochordaticola TaxID=714537 RepID=A0ABP9V3G7_9BACT